VRLRFAAFYKVEECPVICMIDPRTGERLRHWQGFQEPEPLFVELSALLALNEPERIASLTPPEPAPPRPVRERPLIEQDEEVRSIPIYTHNLHTQHIHVNVCVRALHAADVCLFINPLNVSE
jgi:hypothetical protein